MQTLYLLSVLLHVLAAITWVGGMIFLIVVLVPILRDPALQDRARTIIQISGQRFKRVGWAALMVLLVTGITNVIFRGIAPAFVTEDFWQSPLGTLFACKLVLVVLVLTLSAIHDFWIGPKAGLAWKQDPTSAGTYRLRYTAAWIGRVNFLLSLLIVAIGVMLFRGTPW